MADSTEGAACSKCVSLRAACDKLSSEKACLIAAQQFNKNPNTFSSGQLKPLLQEIINERSQYIEQIQHLQRVISLQSENSSLMETKIEELTKSMTKEREKIYQTVKENLDGLHSKVMNSKEKIRTLEEIEAKQGERILLLEADNQELLQENKELKETLKQFSENIVESSDEEVVEEPCSDDYHEECESPQRETTKIYSPETKPQGNMPQRRRAPPKSSVREIPKPKQQEDFVSASPKPDIIPIQFVRSTSTIQRYESVSVEPE